MAPVTSPMIVRRGGSRLLQAKCRQSRPSTPVHRKRMPDARHLPLNVLTPWAAGMGSPRRALTTLGSRTNGKSEKRGFRKIRFWDRWYPTFDSNGVGACQRPALPGLRFSIFPGTRPAGFFHWLEASDHRLPARTSCGLPGVEPLRHRNESLDSDIQRPLTAFYSSTVTLVPTFTQAFSFSRSSLFIRMQPSEARVPMEAGSWVPWMPMPSHFPWLMLRVSRLMNQGP